MPIADPEVRSVLRDTSEFRVDYNQLRKAFDEYLSATFINLSQKEREAHFNRFRTMLRDKTDAKLVRQLFVHW